MTPGMLMMRYMNSMAGNFSEKGVHQSKRAPVHNVYVVVVVFVCLCACVCAGLLWSIAEVPLLAMVVAMVVVVAETDMIVAETEEEGMYL